MQSSKLGLSWNLEVEKRDKSAAKLKKRGQAMHFHASPFNDDYSFGILQSEFTGRGSLRPVRN
jgi:hypothetical protein